MGKIGDVSRVRLYHIVDERTLWLVTFIQSTTLFRTFPLTLSRPAPGTAPSGFVEQSVTCGECGAKVGILVYDIPHTRVRRLRWLLVGLVGIALIALGVLGIALNPDDTPDLLLVAVVVAIVSGWLCACLSVIVGRREEGVRQPIRLQRASPGHLVRR